MYTRIARAWSTMMMAGAVMLLATAIDPGPGLRAQSFAAGATTVVAAGSARGPVTLAADPVEVRLRLTEDAPAAMGRGTRIFLVLEGVRAAGQPGVLYTVHLMPPPDAKPAMGQGAGGKVGTLNFFAAVEATRTYSYDVTEAVATLGLRRAVADGVTVVFVPSGIPATESAPQVTRVTLVAQ
jgi:hypothetical protein